MIYGNFKHLTKRKASKKIPKRLKVPKYDGYQQRLDSKIYKCLDKKTDTSTQTGIGINSKNQQLAEDYTR